MAKRLRWDGLSPERRARFLKGLIETKSVTRAALFAGKRTASAFYQLRERDRGFADEWDAALAEVSARLEAELIERSLAADARADPELRLAPLDFNETMRLLYYFRSRDRGTKFGPRRRYATPAETDAALMERLDVLEARVKARQKKERAERRAARAKG
jgi:hypothetical protein